MKVRRTVYHDYEAWQFVPNAPAPDWVNTAFAAGRLQFTDVAASEIRVTGGTWPPHAGRIKARGWVLRQEDDQILLISAANFASLYAPAPEEQAAPQDFAEGIAAGRADLEVSEKHGA